MDRLTEQLSMLVKESARVVADAYIQFGKTIVLPEEGVVVSFEDGIVLHKLYEKDKSMFRLEKVFYKEKNDLILIVSFYFEELLDEEYGGYQFIEMN